jgi:hypothetical protein
MSLSLKEFERRLQAYKDPALIREDIYEEGSKYIEEALGVPVAFVEKERDYGLMNFVIKVEDEYFMLRGSYDSWNGTSWDSVTDDWQKVKPVDVVVREWEGVKE